jgi:hypothetical protein
VSITSGVSVRFAESRITKVNRMNLRVVWDRGLNSVDEIPVKKLSVSSSEIVGRSNFNGIGR